jgi:hypothetical protein
MNDANTIDLTQYTGAWPPPRDYGLSPAQAAILKEHKRRYIYRAYGIGLTLPLLAFVLPWNILDWLPPLKWLVDALGTVFPLLRVVGAVDLHPQLAQLIYALEIPVALFLVVPAVIRLARVQCELSGQSLILLGLRQLCAPPATGKGIRQFYLWAGPVSICFFAYIVFVDLYGYAAFIFSGASLVQAAQAHAFFGGILTGWGYLHGLISAGNLEMATGSRIIIYTRAFMINAFLLGAADICTTAVWVLKDWSRWRANTRRDEPFLDQLYKDRKKRR